MKPITNRRAAQPRSSRSSTRRVKRSASPIWGASAYIRSRRNSKLVSATDLPPLAAVAIRRKSRPELIQTTFDMGFDRSKWRIQGGRRLGMRKPRPVAKRHADPLGRRQQLQGAVQVDAGFGAGAGRRRRLVRALRQQVGPRLAPPALDVEPGGDAADPGAERALAAEL